MNIDSLKSLLPLWENLARNHRYAQFIEEADISTFSRRATNEGLHFLTTVLPRIGKALDNFFSTGEFISPIGFEEGHDGEAFPLFMRKAIKLALAGDSFAVGCVRQLTLMFYKLEVEHDEETVGRFIDQFIKTDHDVIDLSRVEGYSSSLARLISHMRILIGMVLCNTHPKDIKPSHGGGATACHTSNKDKYHKLRYYPKLDTYFSYSEYFFYSPSHLIDEMEKLEESHESVPRARVLFVPKDSRGPRVISCEPAELMFIQQGLMRSLYACIEAHPLTAGLVNFTDQTINQELARVGSITNLTSTLDLSEASDRVSLSLVRQVFPPEWVQALEACRSEETLLPDGQIVKLNKFSPMGSSCCFPVEALCFWACAEASSRDVPWKNRGTTHVYGDDIIIDQVYYDRVVEGLELIGLKVNLNKSYRSGPFRESCGGDYHLGVDVAPVRLRKDLLSRTTGVIEAADLANLLVAKYGYEDSLAAVASIEEHIGYVLPRSVIRLPGCIQVPHGVSVLGDVSCHLASNDVFFRRRWSRDFQRYEHRILGLSYAVVTAHAPGWCELLRKELTRDITDSPYQNWSKIQDSMLEPGQYVDIHSTHLKWKYVWLG